MKMSHIAWTLWALVPIGLLAFHFGPGQAAYREDKAAKLVARAEGLQAEAVALLHVQIQLLEQGAHAEVLADLHQADQTHEPGCRR